MPRAWPVFVAVGVLIVVAFSGTLVVAAPLTQATGHIGGVQARGIQAATALTSTNWAGYAATAAAGKVTKVSGAWVEPAAKCTSQLRLAAFWVGIDGFSSSTVEQVGTIMQCYGGAATYGAWWEMYPANALQLISTITVHAGDHFSASVTHSSAGFKMSIKDITTGVSFSVTANQVGTARSSAECIVEAPAGDSTTSGLYPLANFGTLKFSSCTATIGGVSAGIGTFSPLYAITMVSYPSGAHDLATVSALTSNKAFHVTWKHAT